jgi:hypothetical protein
MTKKEIIQMAEKAGITISGEAIFRLCQLVEEKEREACAKMCDYVYDNIVTDEHIKDMAFKIRARGQE